MDSKTTASITELIGQLRELAPSTAPDSFAQQHYRWQRSVLGRGWLEPAQAAHIAKASELIGLDHEIALLRRNTSSFLRSKPANHVLLTGPRGCGKTTLMHAVANEFSRKGLRLVVMAKEHLGDLPQIAQAASKHSVKAIALVDELSYTSEGEGHLFAKRALDEIAEGQTNLLVYATSNRRHLLPEAAAENEQAFVDSSGELHPGETTEEKISLADRFGLWLPVFSPDQEEYLRLVSHWLSRYELKESSSARNEALQWARERGSFNGRIARQFAIALSTRTHR